jgi:hypothetical protein
LIRREDHCADPSTNPTEEEVKKKFSRSPIILQFAAKHPEGQEIEQDMGKSSVKKNVSEKLPQKVFFPNQDGNQAEVDFKPSGDKHLKDKDHPHEDH